MTREIIRRIPEIYKKILREEAQLQFLREKATSLPALIVEEKVQTSVKKDSMKYVDAAIDLEIEIIQLKHELNNLTEEAKDWIETLDVPIERRIFQMRLIDCLNWEDIAELIGYSSRRIRQIATMVVNNRIN